MAKGLDGVWRQEDIRTTQELDFYYFCPEDEWDAHGGFDLTDDESPDYDGTGLGDDDIDGYDDE